MAKGIIKTAEGKGAPMRIAPDATAEMLGALESGTPLELLSYGDGWYLVEADGLRGYVAGSMVQALDGIEGLGKISIKKKLGKNGAKSISVKTVKQPKGAIKATPAKGKIASLAKNATAKALKATKSTASVTSAVKNAAKANVNSAMQKVKQAAKTNTATANAATNAKKTLENAIRKAKKAGVTEDEIKQMASLNGLGNLTDLQGVDGLKDLVQKVGSGIKKAGSAVVDTAKKIVGAKETIDTATTAAKDAVAAQQQAAQQAVQQQALQPEQVYTVNPNNNVQNQSTMTDETKSKIKKFAIAGAALVGVATVGVIIYKKKKKQNAAASNGKGALNGVKKRRKSKKSKKNTGNKLLKLK